MIDDLHSQLAQALVRMLDMHRLMMSKVDHRSSFYNAECIYEMNEAPNQADEAICAYFQRLEQRGVQNVQP